jgi:multidrug efflux pump
VQAIQGHNVQVSAGQIGGTPSIKGQRLNATINVQSLLQTPDEFGQIVLHANNDGSKVLLRDVATIELGSENYDMVGTYNGKPAAGMAIKLATGANAISTANAVRQRLSELSKFYPAGMVMVYPYDTTPFVKISIEEVIKTLLEAILLVFFVMFLFLQNFRATLIPTIAVPIVLLGTLAVLKLFGFSINTLTMFAMVLAIGLLVDDAIVVVENVERVMSEEGLSPKAATIKSMQQISSALIGIALVLSAVFVPMAFFGGSTGVIYRQFAVTIISCMFFSVLVALIITPALCASMLKPLPQGHQVTEQGIAILRPFFTWFNLFFNSGREQYLGFVERMLRRGVRYLLLYLMLIGVVVFLFIRLPTAYLPDEDQGIMFVQIMLPAGATQEQTLAVIEKVREQLLVEQKDAVESVFAVAGFSFAGRGQNSGIAFAKLKDWKLRNRPDLKVNAVAGKAMGAFSNIRNALVFAFPPPAAIELGNAN